MGSKYLIIKIGKFFFIACDVCVNVKKFDDSLIENFFPLSIHVYIVVIYTTPVEVVILVIIFVISTIQCLCMLLTLIDSLF